MSSTVKSKHVGGYKSLSPSFKNFFPEDNCLNQEE